MKTMKVYAPCQFQLVPYDEAVKEFLDISEDFQGRDVLKYTCAFCGQEHSSNVFG
jgi:hypothetical protein